MHCLAFDNVTLYLVVVMAGCVHPRPIRDPNNGKLYLVPCGKCLECRKAYQNEWIFRLSEEMKRVPVPCFVTLTYNDNNVCYGDLGNKTQTVLVKSDVQKFLKRLRKIGAEACEGLKYFCVGEYGTKNTLRAHYHLVLMAPNIKSVSQMQTLVWRSWHLGFSKVRYCTENQTHYVCKYMNKLDDRKFLVKPFRLYSRGLGLGFLTAAMIKYYLTTFSRLCKNGSCNIPLPRYFRRKLDAISLDNPYLKKAGLVYSDLLSEPVVKRGSNFELLRHIQEVIQNRLDAEYIPHTFAGYEVWPMKNNVNYRQLYQQLFNSFHQLVVAEAESNRILDKCKIKNGLLNGPPVEHSADYLKAFEEI